MSYPNFKTFMNNYRLSYNAETGKRCKNLPRTVKQSAKGEYDHMCAEINGMHSEDIDICDTTIVDCKNTNDVPASEIPNTQLHVAQNVIKDLTERVAHYDITECIDDVIQQHTTDMDIDDFGVKSMIHNVLDQIIMNVENPTNSDEDTEEIADYVFDFTSNMIANLIESQPDDPTSVDMSVNTETPAFMVELMYQIMDLSETDRQNVIKYV